MTVEQLEEKYEELQNEGNDIYAQMKPLLKRLKTLAKRGLKLAEKADSDPELYENIPVKRVKISNPPTFKTSVGTIAIPEEVVKDLPSMDM